MADQAEPLRALSTHDVCFVMPADMPAEIASYCRQTGQVVPDSEGAVIRCAMESLALRYRMVLDWLQELTGTTLSCIHVVGGGSQNRQLCRMTASACHRPVFAGPVEATAIGNVAMQAISQGTLGSIAEARQMIRASFPLIEYAPQDPALWDDAFERFSKL